MTTAITRREFGKKTSMFALALSFGLSVFTTACASFTEILQYISVGLQAFQSVIDILSGTGAIPIGTGTAVDALIALVKAGFADLQTAVNDYNAAPAANKMTLEGKISTALAALQESIQSFWNSLMLPDPKMASTIQGLLGIILSTLAGFGVGLPAPNVPVASTARLARLAPVTRRLAAAPQKRNAKQFKTDFNAILDANGFSEHKI